MNEETEGRILDELRNLNASARKANRIAAIAISILGVFVALSLLTIPLREHMYFRSKSTSQAADSWREARSLLDQGEIQKGREMTQRLVQKHPHYYYGYVLLGSLNQEEGKLKQAEENYAKAYNLFPTEENEKNLAAIRKAIEKNTAGRSVEPTR